MSAFLLSELNSIDRVTINITNAYVNMPCQEKVAAVVGPEFGKYEGCIVIIEMALYGLSLLEQHGMHTSLRSYEQLGLYHH